MTRRTVLITGGAGGIGRALCQLFKDQGYFVVASDCVIADDDIACDAFVEADLKKLCRSPEYCDEIIRTIRPLLNGQGLNALINNAAIQITKATDNLTVNDWNTTLDINLLAPFLLTQKFLPDLEQTSGAVVNIASIHAQLTKPQFVCYATSKAALVGLTKSMAVDLGSRIRVNAICPAAVDTPMLLNGFKDNPNALHELARKHPLGRLAKPEEVAQAALFLASEQSSFITGESLHICGGISSRLHDPA